MVRIHHGPLMLHLSDQVLLLCDKQGDHRMKMDRKYNESVPPMRKENEVDYKKAMARMTRLGHSLETHKDIIAYMEQEIDYYRMKIERLSNRDSDSQFSISEQLTAEVMPCDKVFYMDKDDVLILHTKRNVSEETLSEKQDEITERTGIKVVIFGGNVDIVGVVRHGS